MRVASFVEKNVPNDEDRPRGLIRQIDIKAAGWTSRSTGHCELDISIAKATVGSAPDAFNKETSLQMYLPQLDARKSVFFSL